MKACLLAAAVLCLGGVLSADEAPNAAVEALANDAKAPPALTAETPAPEVLQTLLTELHEKNLFDGITAVDIADLSRISVVYQDRIRVVLGNDTNMEYKLRLAAVALTDPDQGLLPADRGTLDVSMTESDGSIKAYFDPGTAP